jgi:hypothetical protein
MMERSIFTGDQMYVFFTKIIRDADLPTFFLLMGAPQSISGLKYPVPYPKAVLCNSKNWPSIYGFTAHDLEAFYAFIMLQEQLASLSGVLHKASTWMSIALEGARIDKSVNEEGLELPVVPLTSLVREKVATLSGYHGVSHPVQEAAKTLGFKVVEVLNELASGEATAAGSMRNKSIQALNISLDSKPSFTNKGIGDFGDRRVLDKALRAIQKTRVGDNWTELSFVGRLEGVSCL